MILVSISVMSALSFPYRVGTPCAFINMASLYIYAAMTQRVSFIFLALFVSSLLIDKPKLGSVATNRFVYRKLLGGLGGFYPVPFGVPLWVPFTGFGFCIRKFTNRFAGKLQFPFTLTWMYFNPNRNSFGWT